MTKTLENFIRKLKKLKNYIILREENNEYFIIGTKIIIKEHKQILGNVFQPFNEIIDKALPVFFMVNINPLSIHDKFVENDLPIFNLNPNNLNLSNDKIKLLLDEFVKDIFNN